MTVKRVSFVLIVAIILELAVFNFSNIKLLLTQNIKKNINFKVNDMEIYNWTKDGNTLISNIDPILILPNIDTEIRTIKVRANANHDIPYIVLFYTDAQNKEFNESTMIVFNENVKDNIILPVNKKVNDLRIDLGDDSGLALYSIEVIINPVSIDFSISRVIAIILIYLMSVCLSLIQKNPDYYLERKEHKNKEL